MILADGLGQQLPTTWIELGGLALLVGVPTVLTIWQTRRNRGKIDNVQAGIDTVNQQVSNGHPTNLRDDISRLIEQGTENARMTEIVKDYVEKKMPNSEDLVAVHTAITGISSDVRKLREEVAEERVVRRQEIAEERKARLDLEQLVKSYHPQVD